MDQTQSLVRKAQSGDLDAFEQLIQQQKQMLFKVAKSYLKQDDDVADVLQETILSAWQNLPNLREPAFWKTWITRILINKCYDLLAQRKKILPLETIAEPMAPPPEEDRAFYELLEELPEEDRQIFLLYYGENYKVWEIAEMLRMKENTVKSRLMRGRKKLAQVLSW